MRHDPNNGCEGDYVSKGIHGIRDFDEIHSGIRETQNFLTGYGFVRLSGSGIRQNLDLDVLLGKRTVFRIEVANIRDCREKEAGMPDQDLPGPNRVKFVCNPRPVDPPLGETQGTGQNSVTT